MGYLYETHLHTLEASACGKVAGADYVDYMIKKGYSGMVVTDHFFNGNSCIPRELPWKERVGLYTKGFEHALAAAEGKDFSVLFGVEYNFEGDEFLLYGVDKEWLLSLPELLSCTREEVFRLVHQAGGIMIQAHPYRERGYLTAIHLTPSVCDGIEIYNSGNKDYQNALAYQYGKERNFIATSGSDIHFFPEEQADHSRSMGYREGNLHLDAMGGMEFPEKITSIQEFRDAVMHREGIPVMVLGKERIPVSSLPEECEISQGPTLPVIWH